MISNDLQIPPKTGVHNYISWPAMKNQKEVKESCPGCKYYFLIWFYEFGTDLGPNMKGWWAAILKPHAQRLQSKAEQNKACSSLKWAGPKPLIY